MIPSRLSQRLDSYEQSVAGNVQTNTALLNDISALTARYVGSPLKAALAVTKLKEHLQSMTEELQKEADEGCGTAYRSGITTKTLNPAILAELSMNQLDIDTLDLHSKTLSGGMLEQLARACPHVQNLNVSFCHLEANSVNNQLPQIALFTQLRNLNLSGNAIFSKNNDADLQSLKTLQHLQQLDLHDNCLLERHLDAVNELKRALPNLQVDLRDYKASE